MDRRVYPSGTPLTITQEDIHNGVRGDMTKDPIAIALRRVTGDDYAIAGHGYATTIKNDVKRQWTITPFEKIAKWLRLWDAGKYVPPYTFYLTLTRSIDMAPKPGPVKVRKTKSFMQEQYSIWEKDK